jgi:beta-galactosidase/beta-glucuronidase
MSKTKPEDDAIRTRMQHLHDRDAGNLTPEAVVEDARNVKSPLHSLFEWDDTKAGIAWRIAQARAIIRAMTFITQSNETIIVAPYYIKNPDSRSGYTSIRTLSTDQDRARRAMVDECVRLRGMLERTRNVAKALQLEADLDGLLAGVAELRKRAELEPV